MSDESNSIRFYGHLTKGGKVTATLTQQEACSILAAYDYGIDGVNNDDRAALNSIISKLKDQIWS